LGTELRRKLLISWSWNSPLNGRLWGSSPNWPPHLSKFPLYGHRFALWRPKRGWLVFWYLSCEIRRICWCLGRGGGPLRPNFGSAETVRAIGRDFHPGWAFPSFYPCAPSLTSDSGRFRSGFHLNIPRP